MAILAMIFAFAYWYTDQQYNAGYNAAKAEYADALELAVEDSNQKQTIINDITEKWLLTKDQYKIVYETVIKEVPVYVKANPNCDLSRGAVGLLNRAGVPNGEHPALTETEASTPSTITQRAQVNHCIKWAEQYNDVADRYSRLIDVLGAAGL